MFISELISVKDAINIIENVKMDVQVEKILLEEAYSRILAEDVKSLLYSPPFDKSAMDGYAIKAEDSFGISEVNPAYFTVVDRIGAGQWSNVNLKSGKAIKIATGAPMPDGANAVVMEEYTYENGDSLEIGTSVTPGENVSFKGEDIGEGDVVLKKGVLLRAQEIGMIASSGYAHVHVFKKPNVGVITTGNELVMPRPKLQKAEIINSNHYTLKALVESSLAVADLNHCPDDHEKMEETIEKSLKKNEVIITTGGTAISKGDVVVDVVKEMGEVLIHGVAVKPGKPFAFGIIDEKPIFMLSGYPVAAMVQFDVFVREYLLKIQNIHRKPNIIKKIATRKIPSSPGRTEYVRAKTDEDYVNPIMIKGSGIIRSMVESDSYIIIHENLEGIGKGEECDVLQYDYFVVKR